MVPSVIFHMDNGNWSIGHRGPLSYDINIIGPIFYLLKIQLIPTLRGQGIGSAAYAGFCHAARDLGCREIRQTPSGTTCRGETRMEWCLRRGWLRKGCEAYISL